MHAHRCSVTRELVHLILLRKCTEKAVAPQQNMSIISLIVCVLQKAHTEIPRVCHGCGASLQVVKSSRKRPCRLLHKMVLLKPKL